MMRQLVASTGSPPRGSCEVTDTSMCMLLRPVWMIRAVVSTSWPTSTGREKCTLPTYAVTQYLPLHCAARA